MERQVSGTHLQEIRWHVYAINGNVPTHRRESRRKYSFSDLPFSKQLAIWDELWRSEDNFWIRVHAYFFLERHLKNKEDLTEMWPVILKWQEQVDDWPLCDSLAKIYTKILVVLPDEVYARLKQWNQSENLWKRRQSLVSLLYYSRTKKQYPAFKAIEAMVKPLLGDKEYYVQKGLGWTLREMRNVYPKQTLAWLKAHIKQISPIAFTIAIEKLDKAICDELKALRKAK
jgi:3-methyladenine DNA glycosylase AlkD